MFYENTGRPWADETGSYLFTETAEQSFRKRSGNDLDTGEVAFAARKFSDKFSRIKETMSAAADVVCLVTSNDRGHPLFADTRVSDDHDPRWLSARATWRALFHTY